MSDEQHPPAADQRALAAAKEAVHARLAFVSAAIWTVGVLVLLTAAGLIGDDGVKVGAVLLLLPAGLVWLARPWLVRRRLARTASGDQSGGDSRARF